MGREMMWWSLVDLLGVLAAVTLIGVTGWASWYLVTDHRRRAHPGGALRSGPHDGHASGRF